MTRQQLATYAAALLGALCLGLPFTAGAQASFSDDFTQANDTNSWTPFDGACLTAGDGTGSIPPCIGLAYYKGQVQNGGSRGYLGNRNRPTSGATQRADAAGSGALRLTNGDTGGHGGDFNYGYNQAGAIISSPFNNSAGVNIVFKTITYHGDGANGDGADGMGFFLMDGSQSPYDTGAFGGSLGYTCSNTNNDRTLRADGSERGYDGLRYGYIGLGIDEYGNFLNAGDNTNTGPSQTPGRIGLRGAGSVTWAQLYADHPEYYPAAVFGTGGVGAAFAGARTSAVQLACSTGYQYDFSSGLGIARNTVKDYPWIVGSQVQLSSIIPGQLIATEAAAVRTTTTISGTTYTGGTPLTYNLKITQNGLLSLSIASGSGAYLPIITKQDITASNGTPPATFRFGFTGSTGGSTNVHEVLCFQASPADVAGTSVGVNEKEAAKVATGTQAYLANYYPNNWTGRLTASNITYDSSTQTISISAVSNWDAQCNLSGIASGATNACPTTGQVGPIAAQAPAYSSATPATPTTPMARDLITWNDSTLSGVAFEWSSATAGTAISTAQRGYLDNSTTPSANRLNYLRGNVSNEITSLGAGLYRARDGILGDIVDSSPTWVGPPNSAYTSRWAEKITSNTADTFPENGSTAQTYSAFITAQGARTNIVYDGANDGFLHAFRSGYYDLTGNYHGDLTAEPTTTNPNDGQEVFAYMPSLVLKNIHSLTDPTQDLSNANYSHSYYVDATPGTGDLFFNNAWHTYLAGGLGPGGAGIYILDITDPTQFNEAHAASIVVGDYTSSTITCVGNATCGNSLGNTYGIPIIRRLHDGKWAIIFGNGFGSTTGDAGVFVMLIDGTTGKVASTRYLTTSAAAGGNGIAYVTPADLDTDHIVDYLYAGDLLGNVWRFDLTSPVEANWTSTRIFQTSIGAPSGQAQPITTRLVVAIQPAASGLPRVMVEFGTGRKCPLSNTQGLTYQGTSASAACTTTTPTYNASRQAIYGIWDSDMGHWNYLGSSQFASLTTGTSTSTSTPPSFGTSNLTQQTLALDTGTGILIDTASQVCWQGSSTCTSGGNNALGFYMLLPSVGEQVVFSPLLFQNAFLVNTTIPANNTPTSCAITQDSGDTIAINVADGSAVDGFFLNTSQTDAAGALTYGTGTPFVLQAGNSGYLLTQTNNTCTGAACPTNPIFDCHTNPNASYCSTRTSLASPVGKRVTWIERR